MNEAEKKDPYRNPCVRMDTVHGEISIDNADMSKASIPKTKRYTFDRVFDDKTTQIQLFDNAVAPVVDEVLRGYSCCIFAYGQTGTGKTHTMEGVRREDGTFDSESDDAGIIPRAVRNVFQHLESKVQQDPSFEYVVKMSFLEIYNEKLDDLLSPESSTFQEQGVSGPMGFSSGHGPTMNTNTKPNMNTTSAINTNNRGTTNPTTTSLLDDDEKDGNNFIGRDRLKIISDDKFGQRVAGLEEITVKSPKECFMHFHKGIAKRATAETKCNAASSRSHCVFTLTITMKELWNGQDMLRVGKLNLVDLAGSECVGRSGATERRAREAGNINQSLLTLGRVITALVEKSHHIPYRDSKLTRLLQDSLGGKTKTCIIATVGPAPSALEETVSTLEYANRAKNIKNRPEAHARVEKRDVVASAYMELERLRARFRQQIEAQDGMINVKEEEYNNMSARIESLESQLKDLETLKVATETELKDVRSLLENTKELLEAMRIKQQETEAALVQTTETLNVRTTELSDERTAHDESKVVLRATAHTENILTNQAENMLSTLKTTVTDVAGLHAKVQRSQAVLSANRRSGDMFASSAANRLNTLASTASAFNAAAQTKLSNLRDNSSSFLAVRLEDNQNLTNALTRIRNDIVNYSRFTTTTATNFNEEFNKVFTDGKSSMDTMKTTSYKGIESVTASLTQSIDELQQQLHNQAAALQTWNQLSTQYFNDLYTSMNQFTEQQTKELHEVIETVNMGAKEVDSTLNYQANMIQSFRMQQEKDTKDAANILLSKVTSLVNTFVTNQTTATNNISTNLLQQTTDARKSVEMVRTRVIDSMNNHQNNTNNWIENTQQFTNSNQSTFNTEFTNNMNIIQQTQESINTCTVNKQKSATYAQSMTDNLVATAFANMDNQQKLMNNYISKTKSASVSANETGNKDCETLSSQLMVSDTRVRNYVETINQTNNEISSTIDNHTEGVRVWVAEEGTALHSFFTSTLVEDVPTGRTPAKKDYPAPSAFVATSPADILINRYRQAKSEGIATPERDNKVFAMKPLPPMTNLIIPRDRTSMSKNEGNTDGFHHSHSASALLSLTRYRSNNSITATNNTSAPVNSRLSIESTKSSRSRTSIGDTSEIQVITNTQDIDLYTTPTTVDTTPVASITNTPVTESVVDTTPVEATPVVTEPEVVVTPIVSAIPLPSSPVASSVASASPVASPSASSTVNEATAVPVTTSVPATTTAASTSARSRFIALGAKAKANAIAAVNPPIVPTQATSETTTTSANNTNASAPVTSLSSRIATTKVVASNMKSAVAPATTTAEKSPAPSPGKATRSNTTLTSPSKKKQTNTNNENINTTNATESTKPAVAARESRLHRPSILPTTATVPAPVAAPTNLGATLGRTASRRGVKE